MVYTISSHHNSNSHESGDSVELSGLTYSPEENNKWLAAHQITPGLVQESEWGGGGCTHTCKHKHILPDWHVYKGESHIVTFRAI
jgi:hypothetical protein